MPFPPGCHPRPTSGPFPAPFREKVASPKRPGYGLGLQKPPIGPAWGLAGKGRDKEGLLLAPEGDEAAGTGTGENR